MPFGTLRLALEALSYTHEPAAEPAISQFLQHRDPTVRGCAAAMLHNLRRPARTGEPDL
jgi:hypothetical protein